MRVVTPIGEYPFEPRGIERRGMEIVINGMVAGLRSSVVFGPEDLRTALRATGPPMAALALLLYLRRRSAE
jgi:hypothetical protein